MSRWCLGIDTSNYTTSVAGCDMDGAARSRRLPFDVAPGQRGVRQSDAVFLHTKALPGLIEQLMDDYGCPPAAVCVSATPRDAEGSYMPCFLTGVLAARGIAAALQVPLFRISHQRGHILAALLGCAGQKGLPFFLPEQPHFAYHVSGGTTELLYAPIGPKGDGPVTCVGAGADLHAGQLIDRCGVRLGLKFPCGPALEELAQQGSPTLPPMRFSPTTQLHLSGLENKFEALLRQSRPADAALWLLESLAAGLVALAQAGMQGKEERPLVLAGGVCSNRLICERLARRFDVRCTSHEYAADNACGAALYGALALRGEDFQA